MREQIIYSGKDSYKKIADILAQVGSIRPMLVCGSKSFDALGINAFMRSLPVTFIRFSDFAPNPVYESAVKGVEVLRANQCDFVLAVGGGSAIDTAKCIRRFAGMNAKRDYLEQTVVNDTVPMAAMPTTAGTGSESTHFAVIYYQGMKYSVAGEDVLPEFVILDPIGLNTIPEYQKKSCYLDALCQAIESWWSVRANEESIACSKKALRLLLSNREAYFANNASVYEEIMLGSNYAGRAINITTTTAAHAMSYKLTSLYGIAHGHAVALCFPHVWQAMLPYLDREQKQTSLEIAKALDCQTIEEAIEWFAYLLKALNITAPEPAKDDIMLLTESVNLQRLKNNPVPLNTQEIRNIYHSVFSICRRK